MKQRRRLRIRIPEFLAAADVQVAIDGKPATVGEAGPFIDVGVIGPGNRVAVAYPLKPRTSRESIAPGQFDFRWRGATVVEASPQQKIRPLFVNDRFQPSPPALGPALGSEPESL
jgi:hypothetical protein